MRTDAHAASGQEMLVNDWTFVQDQRCQQISTAVKSANFIFQHFPLFDEIKQILPQEDSIWTKFATFFNITLFYTIR